MPTSNQTDTNNNNNNKITNGRAEVALSSTSARGPPGATGASSSASAQANLIPSIKLDQQIHHDNAAQQHKHQAQQQPQPQQSQQQQPQQQQQSPQQQCRTIEELTLLIKDLNFDRTALSNEELIKLVKHQQISVYKLESFLGKDNAARCVEVRRDFYRLELAELDKLDQNGVRDRSLALNQSQYEDLEYEKVNGACCENVIGHVKVPVGLAGPLVLDGEEIFVPIATTEGCLVASTCRGLSALRKSGGVTSRVRRDFMTRAPIIRFQDSRLRDALDNVERAIAWLNDKDNKEKMRAAFNLTSSHGKFLNYTMYPVSREIHIRFEAQTGDAMGMNMCSKGVESALKEMQRAFPTMEIVTLSGNMCTDKKAAGINWINGRGKSVECNAELPAHVVQQVFKVSVDSMIDRWKSKVMIGSAMAASIGGFNSQAANILTAIFIATGQDPAQNVTSSNCMLILEKDSRGSLVVCCTMPSIECGTVGGGTILNDQSRYLQMMGVRGPTPKRPLGRKVSNNHIHQTRQLQQQQQVKQTNNSSCNSINEQPVRKEIDSIGSSSGDGGGEGGGRGVETGDGSSKCESSAALAEAADVSTDTLAPLSNPWAPINSTNGYTNARKLARIICATVMAGELSLLAALTEGTLVKSHMRHNRSSTNVTSGVGLGAHAGSLTSMGSMGSLASFSERANSSCFGLTSGYASSYGNYLNYCISRPSQCSSIDANSEGASGVTGVDSSASGIAVVFGASGGAGDSSGGSNSSRLC